MALTHPTVAKNAATDAVTGLIGTGGKLKFRTPGTIGAAGTAAATLSLSNTAFGAASGGTATANAITADTNATGNATDVATFTIEKSDGTIIIHGAVAASGSDINLSNGLKIDAGDSVSMSSLTYSALPA